MRHPNREEMTRRTVAWYEDTTPEQRGLIAAGFVILGLLAPPVMITTFVVLAVLVVRLRRHRRIGWFQRSVLAGLSLVHVAFWLARWVLLKRFYQRTADYADS